MTHHRFITAALLTVLLISPAATAQVPVCVPPEEPWVPERDADIQAYVDLVAADFERYFSALTQHFQCLDQAWQDSLARARSVSAARETFVQRATALGLRARLGVDPQPPSNGWRK
ncbi:hypothetical protein [Paracoccus aerius]|uniref:Uncharacterized protein n=1 Tax=Paracoccus aerius TaxID=1915382 RepID=A0ABS1S5H9_9RHOB|nr:hypothetical protein [Paracoccus aerius]MBL3673968.1 hypothetical protein [Paracoccus aerius]GHG23417.1 hypothetical protein GCM10017322_21460 [Paracoccus aerius]